MLYVYWDELFVFSMVSGGNICGDVKFDVDGVTFIFQYYVELGKKIGECWVLLDGDVE